MRRAFRVVATRVLAEAEHRADRRVEHVAAHRRPRHGSFPRRETFTFIRRETSELVGIPVGYRAYVLTVVQHLLPLAEPLQTSQPLAFPQPGVRRRRAVRVHRGLEQVQVNVRGAAGVALQLRGQRVGGDRVVIDGILEAQARRVLVTRRAV